ncbi:hypothetical protein SARC_13113 [Sphaeroforma arctica JP610]|uniref:Uncharacterized protein n=1 Tax=Sphaeroforma arctica JP610 TaxID=667725 RepID=A0A0L0FC50_9EUKA|nr:hypothetical protein SARC_13113 [Sphaeroforma arctica JP610]KNC74335.1 hypothetical protein SARC_13113 [Sphaeroforma arctica JP610]|eukprot:XP_014148237.1 hypothetical protein SARC_13113 [Sphaeroforma arctica JP610]
MFDSDSDSDDDFYQARKMYSSEKSDDTKDKSAAGTTSTAKVSDPADINTRFSLGASGFDPFNNFNLAA